MVDNWKAMHPLHPSPIHSSHSQETKHKMMKKGSRQQHQRWKNASLLGMMLALFAFLQITAELRLQARLGREVSIPAEEGQPEYEHAHQSSHLVIDILSIGSQRRPELLATQRATFGSHVSVRHFFNATEVDDDDPSCDSRLTPEDTFKISSFCKKRDRSAPVLRRFLKNAFATANWLRKKASPVGWMCAQRRPLHGLYKVFQHYRNQQQRLPDYLIVIVHDNQIIG